MRIVENLTADEEVESLSADVAEDARIFDEDTDLVAVCRRLDLSFDARLSSLQTVVLAQGIPCSHWRTAALIVLGHRKNSWRTNATLTIVVENDWPSPDQPDVTFASEPIAAAPAIDDATAMPFCSVSAIGGQMGAMLRVVAKFEQGSPVAVAAQTLALSIFVLGRPGL